MTEKTPQKKIINQPTQSKVPLIVCLVTIVALILIVIFVLFKNNAIKNERNEILAAYNSTQQVVNQCQNSDSAICLYGKTTAVDDYLSILSSTLQIKPSTSYDIMVEVVPSKIAPKSAPVNTDCRPNNHYLYICHRMTSASPTMLLNNMLIAYDNLNPNIEYNVSVILTPRAVLIADDSNPQDSQMVPTNNQNIVQQPQPVEQEIQQGEPVIEEVPQASEQPLDQALPVSSPDQIAAN